MKQIEILSDPCVKIAGRQYYKGDTVTLDDNIADVCIANGWAVSPGGVPNARVPGSASVKPDSKAR